MKLTRILTLVFGISMIAAAVLCADLYIQYSGVAQEEEDGKRYVYLSPNKEENFWCEIARGIKNADKDYGSDILLVQYVREANIAQYFEDVLLTDVDGIIMRGTEYANEEIQKAVDEEVPVIFVNSDIKASGRTCYIGIDNYKAGVHTAEVLAEKSGESGHVMVIIRSFTSQNQTERLQGLEDGIENYPGLEIVDVLEDKGSLMELKEKLLFSIQSHPEIDAIVSMEGVASENIGDLLAHEIEGEKRPMIIAFDLTEETAEYIRNDHYDAVIMQNPYAIGYTAVQKLNEYYESDRQIEDEISVDTVCITKENIEEYWQAYDQEVLEWNSY